MGDEGLRGVGYIEKRIHKIWFKILLVFMMFSGFIVPAVDTGMGTTIFEDDVEPTGDPRWTHASVGGGGMDLWHVTSSNAASPPNSWWCGREGMGTYEDADFDLIPNENPDDWLNDALFTPEIDLSTFEIVDLEFMENYDTELGVDQSWVELSLDGGMTWPTVLLDGSFRTGNSGGWQQTVVPIPTPYTKTMQIRFRFDTGNGQNNAFPGWFIDDVLINGTRRLLYPDQEQFGVPGIEVNYNVTVNNAQGFADSFDLDYNSPLGWTYSFYQNDGITPLTDTNMDPLGLPDTDNIPAGTSIFDRRKGLNTVHRNNTDGRYRGGECDILQRPLFQRQHHIDLQIRFPLVRFVRKPDEDRIEK